MAKTKRYTIDLTPWASEEVDRICGLFGITIADLFRYSLLLMRIYADATESNRELRLIDPCNPDNLPMVVVIPVFKRKQVKQHG